MSKEKQFRGRQLGAIGTLIIFLGGFPIRGISFRVPESCHHAPWMNKAIYCLKIFIFRKQFNMTLVQETACVSQKFLLLLFKLIFGYLI